MGNQDALVTALKAQGCSGILVPSIGKKNWREVLALKEKYEEFVSIAFGLHPYFLQEHQSDHLDQLKMWITQYRNRLSAVGEIGLDFFQADNDTERQTYFFVEQIRLAKQFELPLIIHSRKSHDVLLKLLRQQDFEFWGIIHGFSGSLQQAQQFSKLGFVVGLGGALTHVRAKAMHRLVCELDDDQFVLETDAPDMRPAFALDVPNTPLNVPQIVKHIATLRDTSVNSIYDMTSRNFKRVLGA